MFLQTIIDFVIQIFIDWIRQFSVKRSTIVRKYGIFLFGKILRDNYVVQ